MDQIPLIPGIVIIVSWGVIVFCLSYIIFNKLNRRN